MSLLQSSETSLKTKEDMILEQNMYWHDIGVKSPTEGTMAGISVGLSTKTESRTNNQRILIIAAMDGFASKVI